MSYAQFGNVEARDYNNLAWGSNAGGTYTTLSSRKNIAVVWGVGSGELGYGQSLTSIPAAGTGPAGSLTSVDGPSAGDVTTDNVTAAQWNGLILTINKSLYHQNSSNLAALSGVTVGSDITFYNQISTGVTTAWNNAAAAAVRATADGTATTGTVSGTWQTSAAFTFTVTFASADAARYFFNAGGKLKITSAGPPTGSGRSADWRDLCTNVGTITLGYRNTTKTGGTPSGDVTGASDILLDNGTGGYWNLTSSAVNHFRQFSTTSAYTQNYFNVAASVSGSTGTNNSLGTTLSVVVTHQDDDTNSFQQTVNTGSTASMVVAYPDSGVLANTWGAVSVSVSVSTT
jgi:hypothetical protein